MNLSVPSCELVTIIYLCYAFDWFGLLTLVGFLIMCSLRMMCNLDSVLWLYKREFTSVHGSGFGFGCVPLRC